MRLRIYFSYAAYWPEEVVLGRQYVAVILSDGSVHELEGVESVVPTADGKWAIPISTDDKLPSFPCSNHEVEPEQLQFLEPQPREALADLGYEEYRIEQLTEDDSFVVKDQYLYANKGLSLKHVPAAYGGKSAAKVAGECP